MGPSANMAQLKQPRPGIQVQVLEAFHVFSLFSAADLNAHRFHGFSHSGWERWIFHLVLGAVDGLALVVERERVRLGEGGQLQRVERLSPRARARIWP